MTDMNGHWTAFSHAGRARITGATYTKNLTGDAVKSQ